LCHTLYLWLLQFGWGHPFHWGEDAR
jgi:hypothetical protein